MSRIEVPLCAWPSEGILQGGLFMDASASIQRLTHWLKHYKR